MLARQSVPSETCPACIRAGSFCRVATTGHPVSRPLRKFLISLIHRSRRRCCCYSKCAVVELDGKHMGLLAYFRSVDPNLFRTAAGRHILYAVEFNYTFLL